MAKISTGPGDARVLMASRTITGIMFGGALTFVAVCALQDACVVENATLPTDAWVLVAGGTVARVMRAGTLAFMA